MIIYYKNMRLTKGKIKVTTHGVSALTSLPPVIVTVYRGQASDRRETPGNFCEQAGAAY